VLHYEIPDEEQIAALLRVRLVRFTAKGISWKRLAESATGLSYAEVSRAVEEVLKEALIHDREYVKEAEIQKTLDERQALAGRLNKNT
jgi:AAA+ superfamily predicted ATPase